ncbi:hypothetical protein DXG03_002182 [Asterophora parasitica]|uniref:Inosine/uridine-preferring nucleoside hydrolase domain-containing protein n=1 Tax=Asterophora parasitica TaxID=117018 RepID=A0A9P7GCH3_9AGAR|nr:hypothetical protein DXG03_002182 [Asterophora parasitica]
MQKGSDLVREKIGRVICMGGNLDVPGNTSPVAECEWALIRILLLGLPRRTVNFFADPYAVKELLTPRESQLGLPLDRFLLLPLDITSLHEMPFPKYKEKIDLAFESSASSSVAAGKRPLVHFTSSFLERTREIMVKFGKDAMELHDIVAVWCAIDNPPGRELSTGWKARKRVFDVERTGEITRGMLVIDRREDESAYSPGANRAQIQAEIESKKLEHGVWESAANPAQVETQQEGSAQRVGSGVFCVIETPGSEALLQLLFSRVWGTDIAN